MSDVSDSEKKTNQFIPDVELFFNGIKIADGQIYIADVTPDEISIVFLFGMFSALKRIKDDDRKLYELASYIVTGKQIGRASCRERV